MTLVQTRLTEHPYDPDPDHKRGCYPCCRLAWLLRATPDIALCALHGTGGVDRGEVIASVGDSPHRVVHSGVYGRISQAEFEAYMHVWATAVPRFSTVANPWREPPGDPEVAAIADALLLALKAEQSRVRVVAAPTGQEDRP